VVSEAEAALDRARRWKEQGKPDEAIAELREAIRLRPDLGAAHLELGHAPINRGDPDGAIPEYREAIRLMPDDPMPRATLAFEVLMAGRPDLDEAEALRHARRAAELGPASGIFASILALAEHRAGHWAESIAAAERAIASRGPSMRAHVLFVLAVGHWRRGDRDEAAGWFDLAVRAAKERASGDESLRRLQEEAAALLGRPGPDAAGPG
jgi:tetratricopeptide (TPR) repeat protein